MAAHDINQENPWPWLDPFSESAAEFFNGRDDDAAALERQVLSGTASVLFGKSGLGKTSLLQAGLFPRLRRLRLLPVLVRLKHGDDAPAVFDQIHTRLAEECAAHDLTPPGDATGKAASTDLAKPLWLALHTPPLAARDADGIRLTYPLKSIVQRPGIDRTDLDKLKERQREATILRLAAEGPAMTRGSWAGGSLRGLLTVLAAHRLSDPGNPRTSAAAFGALQGEDLRFAPLHYLREHSSVVTIVAFSPDGRRIVSGSYDRTLRLWDAATGAAIGEPLKGHTMLVLSAAFSPDGRRIVSGSFDHTLRLRDVATGAAIGGPLKGHANTVESVAFSPDGRRIVSGSYDHTLRLWDAATGATIGEPLKGHTGGVRSVAFSPDGQRIVSSSDDHTLRVWPVLESWADALCAKLPRNMSRKQWKAWVGADIAYTCQCPGLPVPPDDDPLSATLAALCPIPSKPQPVASRRSP